jgi:hypothetical protein
MIDHIAMDLKHYIHVRPSMWRPHLTILETDLFPSITYLAQPGAIFAMEISSGALATLGKVCGGETDLIRRWKLLRHRNHNMSKLFCSRC